MNKLIVAALLLACSAGWLHASPEPAVPVPAPDPQALSYFHSGNILWVVNQAWLILIPAVFLFTGISARIRNWAQRLGRRWFFIIAVYAIIFIGLKYLINFPLSFYEGFAREHAYGLSNQSFLKWFSDSLKSLAVEFGAGVLFLWIPYLMIKKSPRRWWFYSGILSAPFLFFAMLVTPIWIDPLFNHFGPMKDKALEGEILSLAKRAGIEGSRVYEVDKSADTNAVNAYGAGLMGTKRIVLWDTIIQQLDRRELLVVMAHEMGHYVLHHIVYGILAGFVAVFCSFYILHRFTGVLIRRYKHYFGFDQLSDIASLPLLLFLTGIISFAVSPAAMALSRYQEHEADRFALEITRDNYASATAFVKLQKENLAVPWPGLLYEIWRASHPSIGERITFSNRYRPWEKGEPSKYESLFSR
jgi:STE24 endopeptidase